MAFDNGVNSGREIVNEPGFEDSLKVYQKQVKTITAEITAKQEAWDSFIKEQKAAHSVVEQQYKSQILSLQQKIAGLQEAVIEIENQCQAADQRLQAKQQQEDAITLDVTAEKEKLNAEKALLTDAVTQYEGQKQTLVQEQQAFLNEKILFASACASIKTAQDLRLAELNTQAAENNALAEKLASLQKQLAVKDMTLSEQATLLKADQITFAEEKAAAEVTLEKAEEVKALAEKAATDAAYAEKAALQNQQAADEIKIARLALNNLEQSLRNRETLVRQAEQKVTGGN